MSSAGSVEVYIIAEGRSEQTFVRDVLAPQLAYRGIYLNPRLVGKPGHKGGNIRFDSAGTDIGNFLKQRRDIYISTMFDYFGIDKDWPGKADVQRELKSGKMLTASQKAEFLETALLKEIIKTFPGCNAESRFIPYIEMHEFEALLFSDPVLLAEQVKVDAAEIKKILGNYNNNPEEIDEDPDRAPSKRLGSLHPDYRKVAMSKVVSTAIGIQKIRQKCSHFNDWLTRLENLKSLS